MDYKERLKVIIQSLGFAGSRPEELCKPPCPGRTRIIKAALSPESEKPAPKKLSDHLPGCAALTTHDKDCDCSPAWFRTPAGKPYCFSCGARKGRGHFKTCGFIKAREV